MDLHLPAHDAKGIHAFEHKVMRWLYRRLLDRLVKRYGGLQRCPWCLSCAQMGDTWNFDSQADPSIDALTCGVCGGMSRWRFEIGMIPLEPIGLQPPPVPVALPPGDLVEVTKEMNEAWVEWDTPAPFPPGLTHPQLIRFLTLIRAAFMSGWVARSQR